MEGCGPESCADQRSGYWGRALESILRARLAPPPVTIACLSQVLSATPNLVFLCEIVGTKLGLNLVLLNRESGVIAMKPSESIKPISFLKTHTADVIRDVNENRETVIITQNGEARAIVQDIATYEQTQETLALLKLLAQGKRSVEESRSRPFRKALKELRAELAKPQA
jgi:prevent-host-death family protein